MIRSRLAVASLSASALGLAAVLVPTASIAEPITETPAASARVIWADAPDDFTPFAPTELDEEFAIADEWQWIAFAGTEGSTLSDFGTFDANGFTSNATSPIGLVHGVPAPVSGDEFIAFMENSSTNSGAEVETGVFIAGDGVEAPQVTTIATVDGFHGISTQWGAGEVGMSTEQFASELAESGYAVIAYYAILPGDAPVITSPPADPENPPVLRQAAPSVLDDAPTFEERLAAQGGGVALRAAAVPEAAGIASFRIGDLTTYFTPQPTAALALGSASITVSQATTTGFTVSGSGFAPGEIVSSGIGTGAMGDSLPDTFVADADGNVSGTIVLPAAWATAGDYFIVLVGESSGQVASSALAITGAAPVAVPVPGEATYTG
ncbi:hypothetical protein ACIQTT_02845 [Microbacterium sp. NPDC090225]|uniref:hypothetical protein n=1 Tax=Microbacterium sp. NPDC090225 TaxID=3364207 RepID=UPI003805059F